MEDFITLIINFYDVEWYNSNGWEYLNIVKGLGFKFYVCQLCVNLIKTCYFSNIFYLGACNYIPKGVGIIMKHESVEVVVCSNLDVCEIASFLLNFFLVGMGRVRNPSHQRVAARKAEETL